MDWTNPILADAVRVQQQRRHQQQDENSLDILQNGHENPAKAIRSAKEIRQILDDCARRALQHAGTESADALRDLVLAVEVQLAREEVRRALTRRHPGTADGQSYFEALLDAVKFLHTRVTCDPSLTAHWIKNQHNYLVGMMDEAVHNASAQHSISKHHFKLVRMRAY